MLDRTKAKHDRARSGVFISYARSDGKAFAERLRSQLEEKGFSLWQDVIAMEGGRDWWLQITDALDHVEFMALVITPNALKSDTVRKEWRYARQQGVCVYPIKGSPDLDFDSMPRWMHEKHFYDLDEQLQVDKFLNDLNTRCEQPRVPFMAEPLPPDFVPRPGEFNQLLSLLLNLESGDPVAITAALRGAGGYGKTTLAQALCHDEEVQKAFDGGILWVTLGESPGDLTRRVIDLIEVLTGGPRAGFSDVNAATARLRELLADRNALLVIDDVWDSVHLTPFTQGIGRGARLITTRIIDVLPPNAKRVDVDAMRREEAVALLGSDLPPECEAELRELAKRLGEWPLLLKLANRPLRHRVEDLHQSLPKAIDWVNKSLDKRGLTAFDARDPQAREQAVSKCLGVSIELLDTNERARFGELAVFPEDIDAPLVTLAKLWGRTGGLDYFDTEALCERLDRLSLLQRFDPNARVIRLHDVVRGYLIGEQSTRLAALHDALLESQPPSSGNRGSAAGVAEWADLPLDEPYLWDHLAHHLIAAGRADELIATVQDLRYLAAKTLARKALAVEGDLLAAENIAPDDPILRSLRRGFAQSGHVLDRCNDRDAAEATLLSRLQHVAAFAPLVEKLARVVHRPFVEALHPLPDLPDPALVRTLTGHTNAVNCCAITADGSIIVSASADQSLKIWDARTGAELRTLQGHTGWVIGCAISADGSTIISASWDNTMKLWDARTGAELRTIGETGEQMGLAISADGSIVVCASIDNELKVLNARTGTELRLIGHSNDVNRCAISLDGAIIVSASSDNTLKLWNALSGLELRTLKGHWSFVNDCAISSDGSVIVSASGDHTLKVWDGRTGTERHTLEGHSGDVNGCAISADGSIVVSASHDGTLKLWEARTGAELRTFAGHSSAITSCAISRDGSIIVSASYDHTLRLWDARTAATLPTPTGHSDWVNGCAMNSDGSVAVSASADRTLKLWDVSTGAEMRTLAGHSLILMDCAISKEGSVLLSASNDGTLKLWDAGTGAEMCTLAGHSQWVMGCAISTDGLTIVSASYDKTLKLWDAITCTELRTLAGHSRWVSRCAISADGSIILSASDDHTLKVWDARTGAEIHTLVGHTDGVRDCAISADGSIIVSAALDNTLRLWNAGTGAELHTLKGHSDWLRGCAINSDGSIIVSASIDNSLKVWNGKKGECFATLNVDGPLHDCALQSDGERIVAVGPRGVYFLRLVR